MPFPIDTVDGLFHDGNPSTNTPGTIVDAAWLNAVQAAVQNIAGTVRTVNNTYPIVNTDAVVFGDTVAAGFTITLPSIAGVDQLKRFTIKNIGDNILSLVAADGKLIDNSVQVDLQVNGDKISVCHDGTNWQSI